MWSGSPAIRARASPCWPIRTASPSARTPQHPAGADESFSFQVDGIDGVAGATSSDDTAATARDLGDVAGAGLIQVERRHRRRPVLQPEPVTRPDQPRAAIRPRQPGGPLSLPDHRARAIRDARRGLRGPDRLAAGPRHQPVRARSERRRARLPRRQQQHAQPHPGHRRVDPLVHRLRLDRRA